MDREYKDINNTLKSNIYSGIFRRTEIEYKKSRVKQIRKNKQGLSSVTIVAALGCIILMISPSVSVAAAKKGIELWLMTVLPSMLPFFIFTDMLVKSGAHKKIGELLERPVRFLMGTPGSSAFAFITSVISGYPAGARIIGQLRKRGEVSDADALNMLSFCSTSGPLFIVGAVGAGMLGSVKSGYILLISHYASAVITGLFMAEDSVLNRLMSRRWKRNAENETFGFQYCTKRRLNNDDNTYRESCDYKIRSTNKTNDSGSDGNSIKKALTDVMTESIGSSFQTMFVIGGYIIIFSIITEYIFNYMPMVIEMVVDLAIDSGKVIGLNKIDEAGVSFFVTAISGVLEMTVGCSNISNFAWISEEMIVMLCSFFISFGGLSVGAQTMSVLSDTSVNIKEYLRIKFFQGIVSMLVTMLCL